MHSMHKSLDLIPSDRRGWRGGEKGCVSVLGRKGKGTEEGKEDVWGGRKENRTKRKWLRQNLHHMTLR